MQKRLVVGGNALPTGGMESPLRFSLRAKTPPNEPPAAAARAA